MFTFTDSSFDSSPDFSSETEKFGKEKIVMLPIDSVSLNCGTQIRSATNEAAVLRYAALMDTEEGRAKFPPIIVYRDENGQQWIADGHHRVMAVLRCQQTKIRAEIREGSKADALWAAAEINSKNGLPLEGNDIRQTIIMLLEAWPNRSLRSIAEAVGCSKSYVGLIKNQMFTNEHHANDPSLLAGKTIGKDGKLYPAIRLKKAKDNANPNINLHDGDKDTIINDRSDASLSETVFTVSLSPNSIPTRSISGPSHEDHDSVHHLTKRQRILCELYPNPVYMVELMEDILAAFPDGNWCNPSLELFEKIIGLWKMNVDAERSLINHIGTKFLRSDDQTQDRFLRNLFGQVFDDDETIDELMEIIEIKRKS